MWRKAVVIGLVAVVAAAGCGGDDDDDDAAVTATDAPAVSAAAATEGTAAASETTTAATADAAGSTAFEPVTIEHAFGSTTFDAPPQRIATIGLQWTDVVLALGVEPIIHVAEQLAGDGGIYPWQAGMLDDSTGTGTTARPASAS